MLTEASPPVRLTAPTEPHRGDIVTTYTFMTTSISTQIQTTTQSGPRIKLNSATPSSQMATASAAANPPRMTGKHPPGTTFGRPTAAASSKTRPQPHSQLSANGTSPGTPNGNTKLQERRRAAQKQELARQKSKQPNGVAEDKDVDMEAETERISKEREEAIRVSCIS